MVKKHLKIGILYQFFENWTGGQYYLNNLIMALLKYSPEHEIVVLTENAEAVKQFFSSEELEIRNPYRLKLNYFQAGMNKIVRLFGLTPIFDNYINDKDIDVLYPATNEHAFDKISNKIFWFADFQHLYYPAFFDEKELIRRRELLESINQMNHSLILSSQDAKNDFLKLYPMPKCRVSVLNFAVTLPKPDKIDRLILLTKYNISKRYFIVSNQFWQHKNHKVVIEAMKVVKNKQAALEFHILFTGKESGEYTQHLKQLVNDYNLQNDILFLGFIPRNDQIAFIKESIAVVQPSYFEGWSTIVEDVKALNHQIILSNLEVHKEQIHANCSFFNPDNSTELADMLIDYAINTKAIEPMDYEANIKKFAFDFINIIQDSLNK
jgi:glycosyltransferase involved in cell wall biosynthesis